MYIQKTHKNMRPKGKLVSLGLFTILKKRMGQAPGAFKSKD